MIYFCVGRYAGQRSHCRSRLLGYEGLEAAKTNEVTQASRDVGVISVHDSEQQLILGGQFETEEAQALTLQSTVMASDPLAVINNEIFRVGQQTHGFRITAIKPRHVTLEKNGTTLTLEMAK